MDRWSVVVCSYEKEQTRRPRDTLPSRPAYGGGECGVSETVSETRMAGSLTLPSWVA